MSLINECSILSVMQPEQCHATSCSVTGESPACSAIKHVYKPNAVISGVSNKIHNKVATRIQVWA